MGCTVIRNGYLNVGSGKRKRKRAVKRRPARKKKRRAVKRRSTYCKKKTKKMDLVHYLLSTLKLVYK